MTLVIRTREHLRELLREIAVAAFIGRGIVESVERLVAADYSELDACESCQQLRDQLDAALKKLEAWCAISGARDLAAAEPPPDSDANTQPAPLEES